MAVQVAYFRVPGSALGGVAPRSSACTDRSTPAVRATAAVMWLLAVVAGCSSSSAVPAPTDPSMLRGIVRIYATATRDLGRPPQNIDELKAILAPVSKDPSEFLRSTRDGEEFAVVWNLNLATTPPDTVLAYERKGAEGKRLVVTIDGATREVTADEFAGLKFPKDYQPEG